jgi:3-isopropylmalate dehydrogenase
MASYKIAVIPGDDSGPEVMESALKVLEQVARNSSLKFDFTYEEVGLKRFEAQGDTVDFAGSKFGGISQATADRIKQCQALLYTAVAASKLPRHVKTPWPFLLKYLNTFVNIRPGKSYPNAGALYPNIDIAIVRETNEGLFNAFEFFAGDEVACSVMQCSKTATRRVARVAFEMARARNKPHKKVSVINKAQSSKLFFGTFLDVAFEVAKEYPDVECQDMHTDYLPYAIVKEPDTLDVVLCTNMLGDLYSSAMAAVIGSIGIGPAAYYGDDFSIFKPSHGTAPDIVGKDLINPTAMILAAKMMLDWLALKYKDDDCRAAASAIDQALLSVLTEGKVLTSDLGGTAGTNRFTQEVLGRI